MTGYDCPVCHWEPPIDFPDNMYIIIKHKKRIIKNFWRMESGTQGSSFEADPLVVKFIGTKKSNGNHEHTKYEHVRTKKIVYPQIKDGSSMPDYDYGGVYESWTEIHCCPAHGEFEFRNANK